MKLAITSSSRTVGKKELERGIGRAQHPERQPLGYTAAVVVVRCT